MTKDGGMALLQHYVCDSKARQGGYAKQRGNGVGNVHGARTGSVVPLSVFNLTQRGSGCEKSQGPPVQNVTPTEQALEIARSEEKREENPISFTKKRKKPQSKKRRAAAKTSSKSPLLKK